jgi:hypothetical protein
VRLILQRCATAFVLAVLCSGGIARGQNPDTIAPEESTAMAKRIVNQLIQALGGPLYLNTTSRECSGRRALIGHNNELAGYIAIRDYWQYPDKDRIEYLAHSKNTLLGFIIGVQDLDITHGGEVITLFSGDQGWVMDRGGVSEMPATTLSQFQAALKQNVENLLRFRIKEPETQLHWAGLGTVDLHPVDFVEITDKDGLTVKLAVDKSTHLLVRSVVVTNDEEFNQQREDVAIYTNYQPKGGVQIPMQVTRERDGHRLQQVFYDDCKPNPGLPADFFTRASLDQRFKETKGKSPKESK